MVDEELPGLGILDGKLASYVQGSPTWPSRAQFFVVDCRPIDLHRIALEIERGILDDVVSNQRTQKIPQILAIPGRARVVAEELGPKAVASKVVLQRVASFHLFPDRSCDELQEVVLLSPFLRIAEKAHHQVLDALALLLGRTLFANPSEQTR